MSPDKVGSADWYHCLIEMMRLGFADARTHVADPNAMTVETAWLLDPQRIQQRATSLFEPQKTVLAGVPDASSCTVSFQVVDAAGNAVFLCQ